MYDAWVCDGVELWIAGNKETVRILMPDESSALEALRVLAKSEDIDAS